jgi:hypothetical protein
MIETSLGALKFKSNPCISILLISGLLLSLYTNASLIFFNDTNSFSNLIVPSIFAQEVNKTKLVYHLSSDEPWRSTIAILDSQTMLKMGYNVTLMLSIEGVQIGVKSPHHYLGLEPLTKNVSDFINNGGNMVFKSVQSVPVWLQFAADKAVETRGQFIETDTRGREPLGNPQDTQIGLVDKGSARIEPAVARRLFQPAVQQYQQRIFAAAVILT